MKKCLVLAIVSSFLWISPSWAQNEIAQDPADTIPAVITLEQAIRIALGENVSVQVADQEIERTEYARRGTYASLFPTIDAIGSYQRTLKKQVMYMDFDMSSLSGSSSEDTESPTGTTSSSSANGFEVGRWNTYSYGITASMPLVNAQLWKSIEISGQDVELAVEKARSSRLEMITQVKQAYYAVLLAKETFQTYKEVYENAEANMKLTENRNKAGRASDLELTRAKANVANAIPNVYSSESQIILALWQLKAVMGVDLDRNIDVAGSLEDFAENISQYVDLNDSTLLAGNSTMRQLAIQAEELANTVKLQQYAYLPTLSAAFSYSKNALSNDFNFSEYRWTPYSYVGFSLSIPIFSGGKRLNDVRQARVQQSEFDLQRIETERQLKIAIMQYLTTMETNLKSYASAQEAIDLAQRSYDVSVKSYNVGKSTLTDLNDAQLVLTQAKLSLSTAVYNYIVAQSNLEETLGHDFLDDQGNADLEGSYGVPSNYHPKGQLDIFGK